MAPCDIVSKPRQRPSKAARVVLGVQVYPHGWDGAKPQLVTYGGDDPEGVPLS